MKTGWGPLVSSRVVQQEGELRIWEKKKHLGRLAVSSSLEEGNE